MDSKLLASLAPPSLTRPATDRASTRNSWDWEERKIGTPPMTPPHSPLRSSSLPLPLGLKLRTPTSYDHKSEIAGQKPTKINRIQILESFRGYLVPQLRGNAIVVLVAEYAELDRYGVVLNTGSEEEVSRLVRRNYGVDILARNPSTTCQGLKHWFLPGWFMMFDADGVVLRVKTPSKKFHYILVTANQGSESPNKYNATVCDSGRIIRLSSKEDVQAYLYINGYTEICPMSIAYSKSHRKNYVVRSFLQIAQVYYDIRMITKPEKAAAMRHFLSHRSTLLSQYFNELSSCPKDQLRFKSEFLLSHPAKFEESERYDISIIRSPSNLIERKEANEIQPLDQLKAYVDALPLFQFKRKKLKFPQLTIEGFDIPDTIQF